MRVYGVISKLQSQSWVLLLAGYEPLGRLITLSEPWLSQLLKLGTMIVPT